MLTSKFVNGQASALTPSFQNDLSHWNNIDGGSNSICCVSTSGHLEGKSLVGIYPGIFNRWCAGTPTRDFLHRYLMLNTTVRINEDAETGVDLILSSGTSATTVAEAVRINL
jgi:hypothetical protein